MTSHHQLCSFTTGGKKLKQFKLSTEPPTQNPPYNPKMELYERQKGPPKKKKIDHNTDGNEEGPKIKHAMNVGGVFCAAAVLCGALITIYRPTDFRNDFKYHSALPHLMEHTKNWNKVPLNVNETKKLADESGKDKAACLTLSIFMGFAGGCAGKLWYRIWTNPLRSAANVDRLNSFNLNEILHEMTNNSFRNCIKGTMLGCAGVLGLIYSTVFLSYLYNGNLYDNKYADKNFWDFMQLTYQKNIDQRREYEVHLELQERFKQEQGLQDGAKNDDIFRAPAFRKDGENIQKELEEEKNEKYLEKQSKQKRKDELYKAFKERFVWDTNLYLQTMDESYSSLDEKAKTARWNMALEMAMLATVCSSYVVFPVFVGANMWTIRAYNRYWREISKQIQKTRMLPTTNIY